MKNFLLLLVFSFQVLCCKSQSTRSSQEAVSSQSNSIPVIYQIEPDPKGLGLVGSDLIHVIEASKSNDSAYLDYIEKINSPHYDPHESRAPIVPDQQVQKRREFQDFHERELGEGHILALPKGQQSRWFPRFTSEGRWELRKVTDPNEIADIEKVHKAENQGDLVSHDYYKLELVKEPPFYTPRNPYRSVPEFLRESKPIRAEIDKYKDRKKGLSEEEMNSWLQQEARFSTLVPDVLDLLEFYRGVLKQEQYTKHVNEVLKALKEGQGGITYQFYFDFQRSITLDASRALRTRGLLEPVGASDIVKDFPDFIFRPTTMDLSISMINDFITVDSRGTAPAGIHRNQFVLADDTNKDSQDFLAHDTVHLQRLAKSYKELPKDIKKNFFPVQTQILSMIRAVEDPRLREELELVYFKLWHENPETGLQSLYPGKGYLARRSLGYEYSSISQKKTIDILVNMIDSKASWSDWFKSWVR